MEKYMSNVKKADQRAAKKYLLDLLPKCSQNLSYGKGEAYIYTNLVHVSSSGMTRWIKPLVIVNDRPLNISYHVNQAFGDKPIDKNGTQCVRVGGCGMDMGFHLVYTLASVLYKDGYALTHRYI